jgi:hypothetical protein
MTDPADHPVDPLAEQYVEGRLHALAHGVTVPVVPAGDDVRRGRRRLLRMRLAMAGGTAATVAVALGLTGLTAGDPTASEVPPATQLTTSLPADPTTSASEESRDRRSQRTDDDGIGGQAPPASSPTTSAGADGSTTGLLGSTRDDSGHSSGIDPDGDATVGPGHDDPSAPDATSDPTSTVPTPTSVPTTEPTPTTPPSAPPTTPPVTPPTDPPTSPPTSPPGDPANVRLHQVLRDYNDVLAQHLDPDRDHLQPYDRRTDDIQVTRNDAGVLFALGSTYRWRDRGGVDALEVTVASGWDQVEWECGTSTSDWDCERAGSAEVAIHDGIREVAVEHDDGQVVVLSSPELPAEELAEAAADDRLTLPGVPPVSPPQLAGATFAAEGLAALLRDDETFVQTSIDRTPEVRGAWSVDGVGRGTLSWSARPVYSGAGWQCAATYRSCTDLVVDELGHTVHVAQLQKAFGGGWVVEYDGPSYAVRLSASDPRFPKKRAYAFLTDPSWQPVR